MKVSIEGSTIGSTGPSKGIMMMYVYPQSSLKLYEVYFTSHVLLTGGY